MRKADLIVAVTTVATEELALAIAERLIRKRIATCVNIVPGVRSIFRWKGSLCDEDEHLLLIKTVARELPAVAALIKQVNLDKKLKGYEVPEILAYSVAWADPAFGQWVKAMVKKPKRAARAGKTAKKK